ncbi:YueI family protein [Bacillus smithii]|uniref:DUF1694 domain-containing protein n=1 Tax=Bacillus smithii 7_3_47FAA TaxID=665952 RepID=G9QPG0_9BACI|nr:YueI family protein [Bacillus smithii]EHL73822.1 hypothetical protein HMPREF1015_00177 [Bacillus smithii 7_3_47FAA]
MVGKKIDDVLKEGLYGKKELKPEERKRFLGTFRERVEGALTISQVQEPDIYPEVKEWIRKPGVRLLLNGKIDYSHISKYVRLANDQNISYTIIQNHEAETDIGLVVAHKHAVDKEMIWASKKKPASTEQKKKKNGLFSNIFK